MGAYGLAAVGGVIVDRGTCQTFRIIFIALEKRSKREDERCRDR